MPTGCMYKGYGCVKYPDVVVTDSAGSWVSKGRVLFGWNRGRLHTNKKAIIFEDTDGQVHVVNKDIFHC